MQISAPARAAQPKLARTSRARLAGVLSQRAVAARHVQPARSRPDPAAARRSWRALVESGAGFAVRLACLALTLLLWRDASERAHAATAAGFEYRTDRIRGEIEHRLEGYETALRSVAGLIGARPGFDRSALHRVLELAPALPEAHVNMGYALLGLQRADAARAFFESALELQPRQANAYYGLALEQGDLQAALGAMRAYLHLSRADDAYRTRARAALWEWEGWLGRHGAPLPDSGKR